MFSQITQHQAFVDLGDAWLRAQTDRVLQRHLQFGQHRRIDLDSLLSRTAQPFRTSIRQAANDRLWRATVAAVEYCERLTPVHQARLAVLAS